jgi:hypothetical protein
MVMERTRADNRYLHQAIALVCTIVAVLVVIGLFWWMLHPAPAGAQTGSGSPPCPQQPLEAWQACIEGSTAAALNQVVSYGAAISQLSKENIELRAQLQAERVARETLSARLDAVAATGPKITPEAIQDSVWQLFFAPGGKDWQHNVIATAENDWQTRHRPWAADFVIERLCQAQRAGFVPAGPTACPR